MNSATEVILTWHLSRKLDDPELTNELLTALKEGVAAEEANSIIAVNSFIEEARNVTPEAPYDEFIPFVFDLHDEFKQLDDAEYALKAAQQIQKLKEFSSNSSMADAIVASRLNSMLDKMAARTASAV